MGFRDLIDRHRRSVIVAAVVGIAACAVSAWNSYHSDDLPGLVERAYYSDDEGQTYFADDVSKGLAFDHNGKQACRVFVYRNGNGKPYIGVLVRAAGQGSNRPSPTTPEHVAATPRPSQKGHGGPPPALEVRKPGDSKWVLTTTSEGLKLLQSLSPDGNPEAVLP